MTFPHLPPTRHCTQMHPLSLQLAVALLPPSCSHRVGMEGWHSVDQPHVEVRPAELRVPQLRRPKLQRQLSRGGGITSVFSMARAVRVGWSVTSIGFARASGRFLTGVSLMAWKTYRLDEPEEHKPQLAH